ncbi:RES domain-containing protein [Psychrobacter sp. TAE2020]|uniref:RES domain-containing protein n=1 Tax=Psychrobacter sp. TAE2020 TaxID=2846762 RepID=UPI001C103CAB|nr:RES domain-containing protein [Psychrobacter sp. TAE2020]MBU5617172.1 RES domain-containing protein [Psychrobacter sp. TAE2020]
MNICESCFGDKELKGFINSEGKVDVCTFCKSNINNVISLNEILDFFQELLNCFETKADGKSLAGLIQGQWDLFSSNRIASDVLNAVISKLNTAFYNAEVQVDYSQEIHSNVNYWKELKEQLKWERRYLSDVDYLTHELGWDGFFQSQSVINEDDILYRGRLHQNTDDECFNMNSMSCPPKHVSTAGRANPMGIPYLYLSDNEDTVLYEIRATYLDDVTVAKFSIKPDLNKKVLISDFTEIPTLYHPGEVDKRIKASLLKERISLDLSQPVRRYDSELDYIPTQFICEFIRLYTDVDGIKFRSSLNNTGINYVIFDQSIMTCTEVSKIQVSKVEISHRPID